MDCHLTACAADRSAAIISDGGYGASSLRGAPADEVTRLAAGPGPIGARIADGEVDILIFFWDPLEPQPHDPDVKALLRLAVAWNIPVACNRATADFLISSPLFERRYERLQPDFADYAEQGRAAVTTAADQVA